MTIYVDSADGYKCYLEQNEEGTRLEVETEAFDGKCPEYITASRFVPEGEEWIREDGKIFLGEMKCLWKPSLEVESAQAAYEIEQLKAELADKTKALEILGVTVDE